MKENWWGVVHYTKRTVYAIEGPYFTRKDAEEIRLANIQEQKEDPEINQAAKFKVVPMYQTMTHREVQEYFGRI